MSETTSKPDFASFDSRVIIKARATKHEDLGYRRGGRDDPEYDVYGEETIGFEAEGHLVFDERLGNNIINIDAHLQPPGDRLYDYPNEVEHDGVTFTTSYADVEYVFDVYHDELRKAAQVRAGEDATHEVRVLASWTWLAGNRDHVSNGEAGTFWRALKEAVEEADDAPEWALCYDGNPERWRHDMEPVTTVEEARIYVRGGYEAVKTAREEADDE